MRVYRFFGGKKIKEEDLIVGAVIVGMQQLYTWIKSEDKALDEILANCSATIIDEAHHATTKSYELLINKAKELAGKDLFPICGLTATPGQSNDEIMTLVEKFEAYLIHPSLPDMRRYEINPLLYFRKEGYLAETLFLLYKNGEEIEVAEDTIDSEQGDLNKEFLNILAKYGKRNFQTIEYMVDIPIGSSSLVYACTVGDAEFLALMVNSVGRKSTGISADTQNRLDECIFQRLRKMKLNFYLTMEC
ncbi:hypothetical protein [Priestia megaterium]|uniref:hypothetical protein n=1 Tax=Priestia megaterium TaxID=1404 RepID=UPI00345A21F0